MSGPFVVIGAGETLALGFDWDDQDWLGSETITTSSWTVAPTGPTLADASNSTTQTAVRLSGCTYGTQYTLRNTITTSESQVGVRDYQIRCTDSP